MDAEIARFKSYLENCKKHMRQCDALTFHGKHSDKPHTIEEQVAAGYDFTPVGLGSTNLYRMYYNLYTVVNNY